VADVPALRTVLARAFEDDPMFVWIFPNARTRRDALAVFFGLLVEYYAGAGEIDVVPAPAAGGQARDPGAVALWRVVDPAVGSSPAETLPTIGGYLAAVLGPERADSVGSGLATTREHVPPARYSYLNVLGVAPELQRRGLGTAVIGPGIARAAAAGLPAHLDTTNQENVAWYEGFGFEVTAAYRMGDTGPRAWAMTRPPATWPAR
jgi:ribosomal protein S18 acetylase RimI-like enzyme